MSSNPASALGSIAILALGKNLTGSVYRYLICVRGLLLTDVYMYVQIFISGLIIYITSNVKRQGHVHYHIVTQSAAPHSRQTPKVSGHSIESGRGWVLENRFLQRPVHVK